MENQQKIKKNHIKINLQQAIMKETKKVGSFHIQLNEILGSGAFANTYKAYKDKTKQVKYACKTINKQMIKNGFQNTEYIINRIKEQFDVVKALKHQNIVGFEDSQQTKQNIYLFLEYCPDGTLKNYIDLHRFGHVITQELSFIKQLIQGCVYLEEKCILHRDIKPENILIKGDKIKIADFGLAKFLNHQDSCRVTVAGTLPYIAPQILKEEKTKSTKKCDVWSVGITIYELLTGYLPFQMCGKMSSPHKVISHLESRSQQDWSEIKNQLGKTLISKMLIMDPNKRITFRQAREIISKFQQN